MQYLMPDTASLSLQVWPFFLWAVFVIVLNAVEFELLASMSSSISLLNIVNFVLLRHHIMFSFAAVRCHPVHVWLSK